jgi:hypothetical protein
LIEIGRESRMSLVIRRIAGTFNGLSALLALVWLIRGPLWNTIVLYHPITHRFRAIFRRPRSSD